MRTLLIALSLVAVVINAVDTSQYTLVSSGTFTVTGWTNSGGQVSMNFPLTSTTVSTGDSFWIEFNKVSTLTVSSIWTDVGLSYTGSQITQTSTLVQVPVNSVPADSASQLNTAKAFKVYFNLAGSVTATSSSVSNPKLYKKTTSSTPTSVPTASPTTRTPTASPTTRTPTASPTTPAPTPTSSPTFASLYVDCGATASYVSGGITWVPDTTFAVGGTISTSATVTNTQAKTQRYWEMSTITSTSGELVSTGLNGVFTVTVYLAEAYFTSTGKRLFNLKINGSPLFSSNIDLYARYGFGALVAFPMDITVTDGKIRITVSSTVNNPTLAAFSVVLKSSTSSPTSSPTYAPTPSVTAAPTTAPTSAPTGPLCKSVVAYDDFSSGSYSSLFNLAGCGGGVSVGTSSADSSKKSLTVKLLNGCGAAKLISKSSYGGGYFETTARLGGQGVDFNGLVYSWYLRECDNGACSLPNEIDFEWLGNVTKAGETQSNWFYNGVGAGVNEEFHAAPAAPYNGFMTLGYYWSDSYIAWYINGVQVRKELASTTKVTTARKQSMFISIWDGSSYPTWAGKMNWSSPAVDKYLMEFQYIKICNI